MSLFYPPPPMKPEPLLRVKTYERFENRVGAAGQGLHLFFSIALGGDKGREDPDLVEKGSLAEGDDGNDGGSR